MRKALTPFGKKIVVLVSGENPVVWGAGAQKISYSKTELQKRLGISHKTLRTWITEQHTWKSLRKGSKDDLIQSLYGLINRDEHAEKVEEQEMRRCFRDDTRLLEFCRTLFGKKIGPCEVNRIIDQEIYAEAPLLSNFFTDDLDEIGSWIGLYKVYRFGISEGFEKDVVQMPLQVRYTIDPHKPGDAIRRDRKKRVLVRCRLNVPGFENSDEAKDKSPPDYTYNEPFRYDGFVHLGERNNHWVFESRDAPLDFIFLISTATVEHKRNMGNYMSLTQDAHKIPRCRLCVIERAPRDVEEEDPYKKHESIREYMNANAKHLKPEEVPEDILKELTGGIM